MGWDEGTWTTMEIPAIGWRPIRIITVAPTLSLLPDDIQTQLADLHNERLSYVPPLTIDPIGWPCIIHDATHHASRTISEVGLRSGGHIVALAITYLDGITWRGGGNGGNEQTFTLTEGEHIIEMLTCVDDEWLRAIQFITNKGRCSAIYGNLEGTPTISRSEGGVLAGFTISIKLHPTVGMGYWMTGVNGIWRHDLIPRAPKENDVYSEYISAKNQHGKGFNDRALIGNSSSIYITCVEIRANDAIHSIEFTYTDAEDDKNRKFKTPRHGGPHAPYYRFELERGEHIVSITGKYGDDWLTQLCFGTNLGRASDVYGRGDGQSFSVRAPLGENGRSMRLQYVIGRCGDGLNAVIFAWTTGLP
ncbi:jacalin-like lectin domain protein [Rhizoctonia solani 123E]|uniref:Jacalin-like lectin domain protein n=1 Tax=Rhizoctonia solani 123E TaxID=1423351 RepID=A0A074RQ53_9AGAM|nr:jacalin-like lectin domain protein [Rhizoctonia solani 123E]